MRAFSAPFYARGDTRTPVIATLLAAVINIALKVLLMDRFAQVGLAFATSVGAWINLALLMWFARRQGIAFGDGALGRALPRVALVGLALGAALYFTAEWAQPALAGLPALREEARLFVCVVVGGVVYAVLLWFIVGPAQLRALLRTPPAGKATKVT